VAGRDVRLKAIAYGTDCYPRKNLDTWIKLDDLNEAFLCSPRNAYQNYNVAVNVHGDRPIYTYMGTLKPGIGNANYCSAGQLSPLLNDPHYRTIGIGTRIFLGGAQGYVFWQGTQHNPTVPRGDNGVPKAGAGTLSVVGDLKAMDHEWVRGVSFHGYGISLNIGIGIPIPVLDEEIVKFTAVRDEDIVAPIVDYSRGYPYSEGGPLGHVSYAELKTGEIEIEGKKVPTASLSSYPKAQKIAKLLKDQIESGQFQISRPAELIPQVESGLTFKGLSERPVDEQEAAADG
jgi:L-aspartate semialdehyde sulfurtransferase